MELLKDIKGKGKKLLPRYDGPFEIIEKISPLAYRLRMPASYGMHPVLNIGHLEIYRSSPPEFGNRVRIDLDREDFEALPEYEVERIVDEKTIRGARGRRYKRYKVRFTGYGPEHDEWLPRGNLKNAPEVLRAWENQSNDM